MRLYIFIFGILWCVGTFYGVVLVFDMFHSKEYTSHERIYGICTAQHSNTDCASLQTNIKKR